MEVISYRHVQPREVFCNHCGAELRYHFTDVKTRTGKRFFVTCPVCGRNIVVPKFEINWGNKEGNEE